MNIYTIQCGQIMNHAELGQKLVVLHGRERKSQNAFMQNLREVLIERGYQFNQKTSARLLVTGTVTDATYRQAKAIGTDIHFVVGKGTLQGFHNALIIKEETQENVPITVHNDHKKIHSHPKMEEELGVPSDHVIIDKGTFLHLFDQKDKVSEYDNSSTDQENIKLREEIKNLKYAKEVRDNMLIYMMNNVEIKYFGVAGLLTLPQLLENQDYLNETNAAIKGMLSRTRKYMEDGTCVFPINEDPLTTAFSVVLGVNKPLVI